MRFEDTYLQTTFPSSRLFTMDVGKIGLKKHHIKALIELDVTDARRKLREARQKSGEKLSFTAWMVHCISTAVVKHKEVHGLRKGRKGLVLFDHADVSLVVEKDVEGTLVPIPLIIRKADEKSVAEITAEIESAKKQDITSGQDFVLGKNRKKEPAKLFSLFPQFIRLWIWKVMLSNPFRVKKMMGTVAITSVGMMGNVKGWLIPYSIHPVCFALGSIVKKPGVVKDQVVVREYLEMTILMDHDVIDGAPAARFVTELSKLTENGFL